MSFKNFHAGIVAALTPLQTAGKIKKIYGYEPEKISGFPCISVVASGTGESFYSNIQNGQVYNFLILLFDDLASKSDTKEEVENRIMELADETLDVLRKTNFEAFGGYLPLPSVGGAKYLKREEGHVRAFEIKFQVQAKAPRN